MYKYDSKIISMEVECAHLCIHERIERQSSKEDRVRGEDGVR